MEPHSVPQMVAEKDVQWVFVTVGTKAPQRAEKRAGPKEHLTVVRTELLPAAQRADCWVLSLV